MKHVKIIGLIFFLFSAQSEQIVAQVSGIGYSVSPMVQYTQWHKEMGLRNGPLYGGQLGLSFGEFVEVRGVYLEGYNLKTDFSTLSYTSSSSKPNLLAVYGDEKVKLRRIGGDLRLNLGRGKVIPFLMVGTGIQRLTPEYTTQSEQIYANLGAGLLFSSANRYTLSLFAQNTGFRFNAGTAYFSDAQLKQVGLSSSSFERQDLTNWSAGASLAFYLGGRRTREMTELDREVLNKFNGGFASLSVPVEPFVAQVNFNNALPYSDVRMMGATAGFDFGRYVGLRGFYARALQEDQWTKFDPMTMYGGELHLKLNDPNGVVPYLIVGGGLLDSKKTNNLENRPFASGGVGLILPINRNLQLHGAIRTLAMTNEGTSTLAQPDEVKPSWMYSAGINFVIGKKPSRPNVVRQSEMEAETQRLITQQVAEIQRLRATQNAKTDSLKAYYTNQVGHLEQAVADAKAKGDSLAVERLQREQLRAKTVEMALNNKEMPVDVLPISPKMEGNNAATEKPKTLTLPILEDGEVYVRFGKSDKSLVHTTADDSGVKEDQMRQMIRDILREQLAPLNAGPASTNATSTSPAQNDQAALLLNKLSLETMEARMMLAIKQQFDNQPKSISKKEVEDLLSRMESSLNNQINQTVDRKMEALKEVIKTKPVQTSQVSPSPSGQSSDQSPTVSTKPEAEKPEGAKPEAAKPEDKLEAYLNTIQYKNIWGIAGVSTGEHDGVNVGLRALLDSGIKHVFYIPQVYVGLVNKFSLNVDANAAFEVMSGRVKGLQPYVGTGLGVVLQDGINGSFNLVAGVHYSKNKNHFFADYTSRNLFKTNRILLGYQFSF
jgi:hypothetical protein